MEHASRRPASVSPAFRLLTVVLAGVALASPRTLSAASPEGLAARSDSSDLVKEAKKRQTDFEFFRQSRIPVVKEKAGYHCDANIGRMCIWFGGSEEEDFPPEAPEVGQARDQLIAFLTDASTKIHDPWIEGQLVRYLVDARDRAGADRATESCQLTEMWWCHALRGYVLHMEQNFIAARAEFDSAEATLPKKVREEWLTPLYIFTD